MTNVNAHTAISSAQLKTLLGCYLNFDVFMKKRHNFIADAQELRFCYITPSICAGYAETLCPSSTFAVPELHQHLWKLSRIRTIGIQNENIWCPPPQAVRTCTEWHLILKFVQSEMIPDSRYWYFYSLYFILTHWGREKMAAILADDTFKCKFVNENILISIKILRKFVPKGLINNMPALV